MKRFEYKTITGKTTWGVATEASEHALVDALNREGRAGWRVVPQPQPHLFATYTMLLEREVD